MKRFIAKVSKSFKGGEKGFTLIELLIVIVILGVLAAAIIPNLSKFVGSGQVGAANAEVASVRTGVAAYQSEHNGEWPTGAAVAGPVVVPSADGTIVNSAIQPFITGHAIAGNYTVIITTGVMTGTVAPSSGLTWDAGNQKWQKP